MISDPFAVVKCMVDVFDREGISYVIGGSFASSSYGDFRATQDVDFVADVREEHIPALMAALQADCYIDDEMIRDAIQSVSSFNIIHLPTMYKADVFVKKPDEWADEEFRRRRTLNIEFDGTTFPVFVVSPEDIILQKLNWYRLGGGVSDRQWNDIRGVLKTQDSNLDKEYLKKWAAVIHVTDLLERACTDAAITL